MRDGDRLLHGGNKCAVKLSLYGRRADQNQPLVGDKKKKKSRCCRTVKKKINPLQRLKGVCVFAGRLCDGGVRVSLRNWDVNQGSSGLSVGGALPARRIK